MSLSCSCNASKNSKLFLPYSILFQKLLKFFPFPAFFFYIKNLDRKQADRHPFKIVPPIDIRVLNFRVVSWRKVYCTIIFRTRRRPNLF